MFLTNSSYSFVIGISTSTIADTSYISWLIQTETKTHVCRALTQSTHVL